MAGKVGRPPGDGRGKHGGRAKGTPNKVTKERRELIDEFLNENWEEFKKHYQNCIPADKLKIYLELIPYTTPKMASVEYKEKSKPKTFTDELDAISGEKTRTEKKQ